MASEALETKTNLQMSKLDEPNLDLRNRSRHSTIGFSAVIHNDNSSNINDNGNNGSTKCKLLCSKTFYCNKYNILRILLFFITIIFIIICLFYSFGQLLKLDFANFLCKPTKTIEEIREHSKENELNHGEVNIKDCWTTSSEKTDETILFQAGSYAFYQSVSDYNITNIVQFIFFLIPTCFLIFCFIYYFVLFIIDCNTFCNDSWDTATLNIRSQGASYCGINVKKFRKAYSKYFAADRTGWILLKLSGESLEIIIQSYALFLYGGAQNSFFYQFQKEDVIISAEKPQFVILFAVCLGFNAIFTGILWLLYHFKTEVFHGTFFLSLITVQDSIFDTFYAIFPVFLLGDNISLGVMAAIFNADSFLIYISILLPITFLSFTIYHIFSFATYEARKQWIKNAVIDTVNTMYNNVPKVSIAGHLVPENSSGDFNADSPKSKNVNCCSAFCEGKYIIPLNKYDKNSKMEWNGQIMRRVLLLCWSFIVIIFGISLIALVTSHIVKAVEKCDNYETNNDLYSNYPELYVWKYCNFKVYPFVTDMPCNCRGFKLAEDDYLSLDHKIFNNITNNKTLPEWLLQRWFMLETLQMSPGSRDTADLILRLNHQQLQSKNMRVIDFTNVRIEYIDEIFGVNWNKLQYLKLEASLDQHKITKMPNSTKLLTDMKLLQITTNNLKDINFVCSMGKLNILYAYSTFISEIPECLANLKELLIIDVQGSYVSSIDPKLFNIESLESFSYSFFSQLIDFRSFGNTLFSWNPNTKFKFGSTKLCEQFIEEKNITYVFIDNNGTKQTKETAWSSVSDHYYNYTYNFLKQVNKTHGVCESTCGELSEFTINGQFHCRDSMYGDGICDVTCNYKGCYWDNGDCVQLCECDLDLLTNDECNEECNSEHCYYDGTECRNTLQLCDETGDEYIINQNDNNMTECEMISMEDYQIVCQPRWIGDGVCDDVCSRYCECAYDSNDCNQCDTNSKCEEFWFYFTLIANSINIDYLIDPQELCLFLPQLNNYIGSGEMTNYLINVTNCTIAMQPFDVNKDGKLSAFEAQFAFADAGIIEYDANDKDSCKAAQVNCSACADSVDQYYGPNPDIQHKYNCNYN